MNPTLQDAISLRQAGQPEQARALLLELLEQQPNEPLLNYHCAWAHDLMGQEKAAVPFYKAALANGLEGEDRRGAMLGLGSTLRALGRFSESVELLQSAVALFPDARELQVFLALALYSHGEHKQAMRLMLRHLVETTADEDIAGYRKALLFYADRLDQTWDETT